MQYYSLNNPTGAPVSFKEATIQGQAPDKGLYFPQSIPALPKTLLDNIDTLSREELAYQVIRPYTGDTIPEPELRRIVAETINFDFPLVPISPASSTPGERPIATVSPGEPLPASANPATTPSAAASSGKTPATNSWALELFHGPTLAFKDVGARFMSRCLGYFVRDTHRPVTVLVATSGDTGGAVASGFYDVEGINVVILYPSGKVSSVQELQLTTLGKNITALEVNGSFDDCQQMVKEAFADQSIKQKLFLTSANSINVARWLPQQFYYFFAWQQWADKAHPPVICVPSGNFGNICAGILAHCSGLPASHFIAACNANDVIPMFLQTGEFQTKPSVPTLSNAMDVANPSNFVRILELFGKHLPSLQKTLTAYSISDEETITAIRRLFTDHHYLADPHGAVGWLALQRFLEAHPGEKGYFLETAHPVKFYDTVEPIIGQRIPLPDSVAPLLDKQKQSKKIEAHYTILKDFLLS
ncbi:threonine synthase [Puia dinghuensis]|uniref:Threonine synthase n=1 Tax=Puia dinghuensis TaxID=1792502 RepID=A0A8J2UGN7_9BACT|nr:threonine synthase [Puia dinghuensis]GGB15254.1 threonine synthase [Puia dinghuensis]